MDVCIKADTFWRELSLGQEGENISICSSLSRGLHPLPPFDVGPLTPGNCLWFIKPFHFLSHFDDIVDHIINMVDHIIEMVAISYLQP